MQASAQLEPEKHDALIEEAIRRSRLSQCNADRCPDAVARAVQAARGTGVMHMFGLVKAGTQLGR